MYHKHYLQGRVTSKGHKLKKIKGNYEVGTLQLFIDT